MDGICGGCGNHCVLRQLPVIKNFGGLRSHPNTATLTRRSAQRIVLYAKDRGCSHPGCDVAGYWCEAHHCTPYAQCHTADVNDLTFGCGGHHPPAEQGWTTRKNQRGDTEWIPPPHLDHGRPRTNTFHHPEKLLREDDVS